MVQTIKLGFLGCGNIGGGVYHLLSDMHDTILEQDQLDVQIVRALVKSIPEARTDVPADILTENADDVLTDPEVQIVCEFMGGEQPAARFMKTALENGKTVVTANKMALAMHWTELQETAARNGAGLFYEASVGGVIPVIRSLTVSLAADRIDTVMGIVNGTTNYILTRMAKEGSAYSDVLADAQKLGLAEPDPTADVEGFDAAYKLSILSSIAFHQHIPYDAVYREGITRVSPEDIAYGQEMGYTLKLLAIGKKQDGSVEVRVHPTFLPNAHPLAQVDGSLNAIFIHGAYCQDVTLQGRGAGDKPTASAICGDVLYAARHLKDSAPAMVSAKQQDLTVSTDWMSRYFVRLDVMDTPGVLASVADAFAARQISIASMLQRRPQGERAQIILITHEAQEQAVQAVLSAFTGDTICVQSVIRVEG